MKNKYFCLFAFCSVSVLSSFGRGTWTIDDVKYSVDTLFHASVGPGTTETNLRVTNPADGSVNNLFYTTVELANPYVEMRAAKAGNSMRAVETVPEIAERFSKPDEIYFAGTNADFFNTYYPYNALGATITNGSLANLNTPEDVADIDDYFLYFDGNGIPSFARHVVPNTSGSVKFPDGSQYIHYINRSRGTNQLVLYTPQWEFIDGGTNYGLGKTGTNKYGVEVKVRPVDDRTMFGNNIALEVIENPVEGVGNMSIPDDGYVLSAHGTAINYVRNLKKGDVLYAFTGIKADNRDAVVKELIGGFPFILRSGIVQATLSYPPHLPVNEPRTAVGYNWDKSQLTMLVVDGRGAGGSAGVNQNLLAKFMYKLGCLDAMNFDGGGSSTLYVEGLGVRNVPSTSSLDSWRPEGYPRVVVNALFAVATAPVDNEVASIEIREKRLDLTAGQSYTPTVYGYNQYGVLVDSDVKDFTCEIAPQLGSVSGSTITAGTGCYKGDLKVTSGSSSFSIPVFVNGTDGEYVNSGVDVIEVDDDLNQPVRYYTPLGQFISHPAPGQLVIERRGSSVTRRIFSE